MSGSNLTWGGAMSKGLTGSYPAAIEYLTRAIQMAREMQGVESVWAVTWCNLGHSYRMTG